MHLHLPNFLCPSHKREFSLALGGGSARWLAHIWAIKYMEDSHIRITALAGTSMGAVIAAFYAKGYTGEQMHEIVRECNYLSLIDFDLTSGILKGEKVMKFFEKYLQDTRFEDLLIPLSIVATDIDTGEKVVIKTGKITEALRASVSIPGVFAPYRLDGHNLVDGGLTENLPIEELPSGDTIAISVQIPLIKKYGKNPDSVKSRFFPNGHIFQNSYEMFRKTIDIMIDKNEKISLASRKHILHLRPEREDIDYSDFGKAEDIIAEGYKKAKEILGK